MASKTVVVTGGSGAIGRVSLVELNNHGYHTLDCNRSLYELFKSQGWTLGWGSG